MAEKNQEIVLKVLMHCEGCKSKVSSCLRYFEGIEEVEVDYPNNRVVVKGKRADPLKVLERVQKKYSRNAELISPKLKPENKERKEPEKKQVALPQVKVVVLKMLMHCQGCETDIKNCLEGLKGVLNAEANMGTSMVTVRGIVDPPKLIEHIKKQLGKHAEFVRQEEEIGRGKGKDKDKDKDKEKSEDNSTCNITNKICPEVEIRFQYPPQYSVDHIYPCQMFSDENPLACSMM
ncbi:PREDICTED: heavy metal-associated isoprenylated plant protein 26 [Fragaria vesca subsp. vesca]|uniref:heavy metal-associated isoprenylated plant protein 26 n=1 Tax=Fragaria vesca subsp. vesca TaxID=101020 RepID=UPI0002C2F2BD|nr:PREDICTED: heavy metal-associated isoprenylated plant protein 26 [Fragaria vesca subsp. vesca]